MTAGRLQLSVEGQTRGDVSSRLRDEAGLQAKMRTKDD
jgi:hypothetical protein